MNELLQPPKVDEHNKHCRHGRTRSCCNVLNKFVEWSEFMNIGGSFQILGRFLLCDSGNRNCCNCRLLDLDNIAKVFDGIF